MKRSIALILMLTTLLTFTQKAIAFASLLDNGEVSMEHCPMLMELNSFDMDNMDNMDNMDCGGDDLSHTMECQNDCDFMTVITVLYFVEHEHSISQPQLLLSYNRFISTSPYYFPESLYRPPFLS